MKNYAICILFVVLQFIRVSNSWNVAFDPENVQVHMNKAKLILFNISDVDTYDITSLTFGSESQHIANVDWIIDTPENEKGKNWSGSLNVTGNFLGELNLK